MLPPIPEEAEHIWMWFQEIASGRTSNGYGPNPLSWVDIDAWARLTGRDLRRSEIAAIMDLDFMWRKSVSQAK